jgi:hypothetical protein
MDTIHAAASSSMVLAAAARCLPVIVRHGVCFALGVAEPCVHSSSSSL